MTFLTDLLPHQIPAVDKLGKLKIGALFMDTGTGKTRTALELLKQRLDKGYIDKVLWLCPCSVIENLKQDLIRHCGDIPPEIKICGIESISASGRIYLELLEYIDSKTYLIVDESSLVKNPKAIRSQRIEMLADKCTHKLILNGTPITRCEADLYQQFRLLDWEILGYKSYWSFAANHLEYKEVRVPGGGKVRTNQIVRCHNTDYLAAKVDPYSYQVKKEDCFELPKKCYSIQTAYMTYDQAWHYDEVKEDFLSQVDELDSSTIYRLFTACQHVASGRKVSDEKGYIETSDLFNSWRENPRVICLQSLVKRIDGKCIIFAKYQREIEEIKAMLDANGLSWAEFTGNVSLKDRDKSIEEFRGDTQFLLANKTCGAFGLNLQFCHNMIFYSNDFNYGTRLQAEDRIHRFGQTEECWIYDIVMEHTIDGFINDNLGKKGGLVEAFKKEMKKMKEKDKETTKLI